MREEWRPVVGYEDRYLVSNYGKVKSLDILVNCKGGHQRLHIGREKPIRKNNRGYCMVNLCRDNKCANALVHRVVAEAFIPVVEGKPQVNHIDGNISNNCVDNLEWVTDNENKLHSAIYTGGTQRPMKAVLVTNINTGETKRFDGLRVAERSLSLDHKSALNVLKGRQHQTKGYTLCYV